MIINSHFDRLPVGLTVAMKLRPFFNHSDAAHPPWAGKIVPIDDPRVWARTMRFHDDEPDPTQVTAWVEYCLARHLLTNKIGVLWEHGTGRLEVATELQTYTIVHDAYLAQLDEWRAASGLNPTTNYRNHREAA